MVRKSPHKHKVRSHKRRGFKVRQYTRGKGNQQRKSRVVRKPPFYGGSGKFRVDIDYGSEGYETTQVAMARGFPQALSRGLEKREKIIVPNKITVTEVE